MNRNTELAADSARLYETKAGAPASDISGKLDRLTSAIETNNALARKQIDPAAVRSRVDTVRTTVQDLKQRALGDMREANEQNERPGRRDVLLEEKRDRANAALDAAERKELDELRAKKREIIRKSSRPGGPTDLPVGRRVNELKAMSRAAAINYLRTGETQYKGRSVREWEAMAAPEAKTLSGSTNADGGYLVIPEYDQGPIEKYLAQVVPMRQHAEVKTISAYEYRKPIRKSLGTAQWGNQVSVTAGSDTTPQYDLLSFPAIDLYAAPAVSADFLDDSAWDIEAEIASGCEEEFSLAEATAFISGTGTGQPLGVLGMAAGNYVADATWVHGKLGYVASGTAATIGTADQIINLAYALKGAYRQMAKYMMNRSTIGKVRLLKDTTNQYIWQNGNLAQGQPNMLNGYEVIEAEQMPNEAANSFPIAFGDWRRGYLIVDRLGMTVLRDPYTLAPLVKFLTRKRVGGGIKNFESIKLLKCAAA